MQENYLSAGLLQLWIRAVAKSSYFPPNSHLHRPYRARGATRKWFISSMQGCRLCKFNDYVVIIYFYSFPVRCVVLYFPTLTTVSFALLTLFLGWKLQLTNPLSFCLNRWFNRAYTNGFTAEFNIISIVAAAQISSLGL